MTIWCVDANLVIATLLRETATTVARTFWSNLAESDRVIAPLVLLPECTSVLRRSVARGVITDAEGYQAIEDMLSLPIRVEGRLEQFRLSFDWATRMKRIKTHDLQYLAVAQELGAIVVTLDGGLEQAATEHRVPVRLLS